MVGFVSIVAILNFAATGAMGLHQFGFRNLVTWAGNMPNFKKVSQRAWFWHFLSTLISDLFVLICGIFGFGFFLQLTSAAVTPVSSLPVSVLTSLASPTSLPEATPMPTPVSNAASVISKRSTVTTASDAVVNSVPSKVRYLLLLLLRVHLNFGIRPGSRFGRILHPWVWPDPMWDRVGSRLSPSAVVYPNDFITLTSEHFIKSHILLICDLCCIINMFHYQSPWRNLHVLHK